MEIYFLFLLKTESINMVEKRGNWIYFYILFLCCVFLSITPRISSSNKKKRVIHIFVLTVATIGLEQWVF